MCDINMLYIYYVREQNVWLRLTYKLNKKPLNWKILNINTTIKADFNQKLSNQ